MEIQALGWKVIWMRIAQTASTCHQYSLCSTLPIIRLEVSPVICFAVLARSEQLGKQPSTSPLPTLRTGGWAGGLLQHWDHLRMPCSVGGIGSTLPILQPGFLVAELLNQSIVHGQVRKGPNIFPCLQIPQSCSAAKAFCQLL